MKKRTLSFLLALIMCLSLLPMTAMAAIPATVEAPANPKAALDNDVPDAYISYTDEIVISFHVPDSIKTLLAGDAAAAVLQVDWSINSESDWKCTGQDTWDSIVDPYCGPDVLTITAGDIVEQVTMLHSNYYDPAENGYDSICYGINDSGDGWLNLTDNTVYFRMRFVVRDYDNNKVYSDWTEVFTVGKEVDDEEYNASEWAQEELQQADELGLLPDCLEGQDLAQDINRAEFAAVCVKVYENLSGTAALPAVTNPFTDCKDVEVLKAYNVGITAGTSATTFSPDTLLNREQMATMLTRTFKRCTMPGWTLATDGEFKLNYTKPATFADDKDISGFAYDSVYFMAANGIIKGFTGGNFGPKNITDQQSAEGYANATREQALVVAVRMVQNLGE